jgi:hypothetical protein
MPKLLTIDVPLFLPINIAEPFWEPATKFCFFTYAMPTEIRRFEFTVSWPCEDRIASGTFVVKGP